MDWSFILREASVFETSFDSTCKQPVGHPEIPSSRHWCENQTVPLKVFGTRCIEPITASVCSNIWVEHPLIVLFHNVILKCIHVTHVRWMCRADQSIFPIFTNITVVVKNNKKSSVSSRRDSNCDSVWFGGVSHPYTLLGIFTSIFADLPTPLPGPQVHRGQVKEERGCVGLGLLRQGTDTEGDG